MRTCLTCVRLEVDAGSPDQCDGTLGDPTILRCEIGCWDAMRSVYYKREHLREAMHSAADCPGYEHDPQE